MEQKSEFFTLKGYYLKDKKKITNAMEDYLEMIYRMHLLQSEIHIKDLGKHLNVSTPSVSKMMNRLKDKGLVVFEKYGKIKLSSLGEKIGSYLLWRHEVLTDFFLLLNKDNFSLKQVEKIEHFVDYITVVNIYHINSFMKKSS